MVHGPEIVLLESNARQASIVNDSVPYQRRVNGPPPGGGPSIPELSSTTIGAAALSLDRDALWILTGGDFGQNVFPRTVVKYSVDGVELGRRELPFGALHILIDRDRLYVLPMEPDLPALYAFDLPRSF
jgi:hypothetical protein